MIMHLYEECGVQFLQCNILQNAADSVNRYWHCVLGIYWEKIPMDVTRIRGHHKPGF
jgi:hypothetical protein